MNGRVTAAESFLCRFSDDSLAEIFVSEVFAKPTVGIDKVTVAHFASNLDANVEVISRKVKAGSYQFTSYSQLLSLKGADSLPRELCIPTVRDKVTLKALSHVLDDVFGDECKTGQPQMLVDRVVAAASTGKFDTYLKFDLKRFYSSINHNLLLKTLRRRMRKKELLDLIEDAITTPSVAFGASSRKLRTKGVPEGLPISNRLANLFLRKLDLSFSMREGIAYYRYVDDVLVLCGSHAADDLIEQMKNLTGRLDLELNSEKTKCGLLANSRLDFLGYTFFGNCAHIGIKAKRNIERSLETHFSNHREDSEKQWLWRLNLRITGCRITEDGASFQRFGWLYYYSRADEVAYLSRLDSLIRKIARRRDISLPEGVKSFKKAFYEIKYKEGRTKYIPTFDLRMPVEEKRRILSESFGMRGIDQKTDDEVSALFNRNLRREVSLLEKDVGLIS